MKWFRQKSEEKKFRYSYTKYRTSIQSDQLERKRSTFELKVNIKFHLLVSRQVTRLTRTKYIKVPFYKERKIYIKGAQLSKRNYKTREVLFIFVMGEKKVVKDFCIDLLQFTLYFTLFKSKRLPDLIKSVEYSLILDYLHKCSVAQKIIKKKLEVKKPNTLLKIFITRSCPCRVNHLILLNIAPNYTVK